MSTSRRPRKSEAEPIVAEIVGSDEPRGQPAGDAALRERVSSPCTACGAPQEENARFCVACGSPLESAPGQDVVSGESGAGASALPDRAFECKNCGSQVATSVDQRSYICPFCDSAYVTEIPTQQSGKQRPEFVVGFTVTSQQAKELFYQWLGKNSWLRPGDLATKAVAEKQKGVYLPFWHFSMRARSRWSATIGEYWYRTETYTTTDSKGKRVTRTRQVREVEWFPLSGTYQRYHYGFLVPASKSLTHEEARAIQPFRLSALTRYRPYFLAGWMSHEYTVAMERAIDETEVEFRRRQEAEVARFLPGNTHRRLHVQTELEVNGSDLSLLPVHVLSYRYRDQVYRFLVNGQTGKVSGQKPLSPVRIAILVTIGLLLVTAVVVAALILSSL